ncbi:MAG TPA: TonB C-terminal domain-containing protein [Polyangiaceae bacterium]|jgi:hypothetical protein|nr:TonB C-terminal domain-containing protein [Polyangiaceae bacterium]
MTTLRSFQPHEVALAAGFAVIIECGLSLLIATASNQAHIKAIDQAPPEPIPIEVKPILDDVPMLKLGGKRVRAKLPDMWVRKPPVVKRYEATSAPTPKAPEKVDKLPDTPLTKPNKEPPPPDASIAKKVEETPKPDEKPTEVPNVDQPGAADGVKEGTETDPLKAFAVSQYRIKISSWFNSRFKRPSDEIPCAELKKLRASVTASISGERTVSSYSITKPSGNAIFDGRVKSTLDAIVSGGSELPPPPPDYADVLGSSISVAFFVPSCE